MKPLPNHESFVLTTYARTWRVGSGLAATLRPGEYHLTRHTSASGRSQIIIDECYYLNEEEFAGLIERKAAVIHSQKERAGN
jgi:hypothetical protein